MTLELTLRWVLPSNEPWISIIRAGWHANSPQRVKSSSPRTMFQARTHQIGDRALISGLGSSQCDGFASLGTWSIFSWAVIDTDHHARNALPRIACLVLTSGAWFRTCHSLCNDNTWHSSSWAERTCHCELWSEACKCLKAIYVLYFQFEQTKCISKVFE